MELSMKKFFSIGLFTAAILFASCNFDFFNPTEPVIEQPADTPTDSTTEKPKETSTDKPDEKPADKPADKTDENPCQDGWPQLSAKGTCCMWLLRKETPVLR